jgi:hypothetical protein
MDLPENLISGQHVLLASFANNDVSIVAVSGHDLLAAVFLSKV